MDFVVPLIILVAFGAFFYFLIFPKLKAKFTKAEEVDTPDDGTPKEHKKKT